MNLFILQIHIYNHFNTLRDNTTLWHRQLPQRSTRTLGIKYPHFYRIPAPYLPTISLCGISIIPESYFSSMFSMFYQLRKTYAPICLYSFFIRSVFCSLFAIINGSQRFIYHIVTGNFFAVSRFLNHFKRLLSLYSGKHVTICNKFKWLLSNRFKRLTLCIGMHNRFKAVTSDHRQSECMLRLTPLPQFQGFYTK